MNKRTKGALAMVLAGSITFSVTNVLLADQSSKQLIEEKALTTSENPKKADVINQPKKTVIDQSPTPNAINVQANPSNNIAENTNKSDTTITANQQSKESVTTRTAANNTKEATTTTPAATSVPATSTKAPAAATTTPATTTTSTKTRTDTTSPTTTNHGQQVSQAVKETPAGPQDNKGNNGKNM